MSKSTIIKKISYSVFANVISLLVSIFMVIIVPKFLSLEDYGLWQLFLFYYSYIGFFHFGWEDGIYLRYAGNSFETLDSKLFAGQLYGIIVLQLLVSAVVLTGSMWVINDPIKQRVLWCIVFIIPFVNFNNACNQIMQFTDCIKRYATLVLLERTFLLSAIVLCFAAGFRTFSHLYFAKVFSIVSVSLVGAYWCKSLLKLHFYPLKESLKEASINLSVGSKLMFANIASMLIIGIVRYGISIGWDITTFGKISLTLNVSNFLMVFISAVSVVLFPLLKHMEWGQLSNLYIRIRNCLSILILGAMIFYYPMKSLLSWWLPKYADSLIYMAVLFPVCLFECKVTLLVNTYLKSMRQEALILKINGIAVISSMMLTVVSVALFHNLTMAVFSIVFLYAGRCFLAEYHLQKLLSLNLRKDMMQEMLLVLVFIATGWKLNSWMTMIIYALCYGCYFILNRSKVHDVIMLIKK